VKLVPGSKFNFKITTPEDLAMAEAYLARAQGGGTAAPPPVGGVL
jgi:2-C-methyl-D-erythritol 4-phosphate cytidylyltransferase